MEEECPHCKSKNTGAIEFKENGWVMQCNDCGKDWFIAEYNEKVNKLNEPR
jgi:transcription elongation factor Elf1